VSASQALRTDQLLRLRVLHPRLPVIVRVIASTVPQCLPYKGVIEGIHEPGFAIPSQPCCLEIFDRAAMLARSSFRHILYPLLLRRAGGRLSGAESSERSNSLQSRANAIVAASAIDTSGRFRGLPNLSVYVSPCSAIASRACVARSQDSAASVSNFKWWGSRAYSTLTPSHQACVGLRRWVGALTTVGFFNVVSLKMNCRICFHPEWHAGNIAWMPVQPL
jgi:hypothetical protein